MCMSFLTIFSQEHMTFQGIPIDGTIKEFTKQMKKHGFKLELRGENGYFFKGRYITSSDFVGVYYSPKSKTVWKVCAWVNFSNMTNTESWAKTKGNYDYVVSLFSEKYNTAKKETIAYFEAPYEEGDGNEIAGILNGKCNYITQFNLPYGSVQVDISTISQGLITRVLEDYNKEIPTIRIGIEVKNDANDVQL